MDLQRDLERALLLRGVPTTAGDEPWKALALFHGNEALTGDRACACLLECAVPGSLPARELVRRAADLQGSGRQRWRACASQAARLLLDGEVPHVCRVDGSGTGPGMRTEGGCSWAGRSALKGQLLRRPPAQGGWRGAQPLDLAPRDPSFPHRVVRTRGGTQGAWVGTAAAWRARREAWSGELLGGVRGWLEHGDPAAGPMMRARLLADQTVAFLEGVAEEEE